MEVIFKFERGGHVSISANVGDNLLDVAKSANVVIDAPCSGNGACGKCMVRLVRGTVEGLKTLHISQEDYDAGWRLACVSTVCEDVEVMVPDIASAYQGRMKIADLSSGKEQEIFRNIMDQIQDAGIDFTNNFASVNVDMEEPSLDDTLPDNERLIVALQGLLGLNTIKITFSAMVRMAKVLRENNFKIRCDGLYLATRFVVFDVVAQEETAPMCAVAMDIGTTSVAAILTDLKTGEILAKASTGNAQIRYGADVINRILEQQKKGGVGRLQEAVVQDTINPLFDLLCQQVGIGKERIMRISVAANTTMNHLFLGLDGDPIRMEPYIPSFFINKGMKAGYLGLHAHPQADLITAPNIGSYVGGDITAGVLATMMWNQDEFSLFVDLGTNGEIVFGNSDFMMSCACSAGPAFEGGDISCGMRATDGAIEALTIDCATMEPNLSIIGDPGQKPIGLCGSGIIDVIAELFRCRMITPKGKFVRNGGRIVHDRHGTGRYVLATAAESHAGREVAIDEIDIDNFIRAKGAIYSAIDCMLTALDMDVSVLSHVYVAGGIGSGINMENAVRIGMFPDIGLDNFQYIGNSSLEGVYAMVISNKAREKIYDMALNMTYLELSTHPGYMDSFIAACFLPHTDSTLFPSSTQEEI